MESRRGAMLSINNIKKLNLFWILCSLMIYSYLPSIFGIRPIFITVIFQGFGIILSLVVILYGINRAKLLPSFAHKALFLLWLLYFLRMTYSILFDKSLSVNEYLYDDINKYFTYNFQLGLSILSLSIYKYDDLIRVESIFYKVLFGFILISLVVQSNSTNDVRSDANSYIPTLLYGQYGCALALLSIHRFYKYRDGRFFYFIAIAAGLYVIGIAGSRSAFLSFLLVLLIMLFFQGGDSKLRLFLKIASLSLAGAIYLNIGFFISLIGMISGGFADRLEQTFLGDGNVDAGIREVLFGSAWEQFSREPIFGSHFVLLSGVGRGWYPHNLMLEVLINVGVVGGVLLIVAISRGMVSAVKMLRRDDALAWVAILFFQFSIFSLFSLPMLRHTLLFAFLTMILCVSASLRNQKI